jgi:hypothetical protein
MVAAGPAAKLKEETRASRELAISVLVVLGMAFSRVREKGVARAYHQLGPARQWVIIAGIPT